MQQSSSWKADRSSASQEISLILWNSKVHHRIYNSPPPVPILSQFNMFHFPLHDNPWKSFSVLPPRYAFVFQVLPFPQLFSKQNPVSNSAVSHTLYMPRPSSFPLFHYPNNIWLGVKIKICFLCGFLHTPVASSLLGPNIFLSNLLSKTLSLFSSSVF